MKNGLYEVVGVNEIPIFFEADSASGYFREYHNDKLVREYDLNFGELDGLFKEFDENGKLKYEKLYKKGKLLSEKK